MRRRRARATVRFSSLAAAQSLASSWRVRFRGLLTLARIACIVLLVVALARPRRGSKHHRVATKGAVIQLVVDRSSSMAQQMPYKGSRLTRLEVVKRVLDDFIAGGDGLAGRANDLLGLITFAGFADTNCPLVHAHDAVRGFLKQTDTVQLRSEDGTAIGDALALAAARLDTAAADIARRNAVLLAQADPANPEQVMPDFQIKSKAIILLTDGMNNRGRNSPLAAADLAKKWGIKIYTIGIGAHEAFSQIDTPFGLRYRPIGSGLDESLLKEIAQRTGGIYGSAGDAQALHKLFERIDQLEETEAESVQYSLYTERFAPWAAAALLALAVEMLLACTAFRKVP